MRLGSRSAPSRGAPAPRAAAGRRPARRAAASAPAGAGRAARSRCELHGLGAVPRRRWTAGRRERVHDQRRHGEPQRVEPAQEPDVSRRGRAAGRVTTTTRSLARIGEERLELPEPAREFEEILGQRAEPEHLAVLEQRRQERAHPLEGERRAARGAGACARWARCRRRPDRWRGRRRGRREQRLRRRPGGRTARPGRRGARSSRSRATAGRTRRRAGSPRGSRRTARRPRPGSAPAAARTCGRRPARGRRELAGPPGTGCSSSPTGRRGRRRASGRGPWTAAGCVRAGAASPSVSAAAAAQVVLPTPPFPANRSRRMPGGATSGTHRQRLRGLARRGGRERRRPVFERGARLPPAAPAQGPSERRGPASPRAPRPARAGAGWERPAKAFRTCATARCSAATRRRSHGRSRSGRSRPPRFTRISSTAMPAASRRLHGVARLLDGQHLRQDIQRKRQRRGSRRSAGQPARLGVDLGHEVVCRVAPVRAPQARQRGSDAWRASRPGPWRSAAASRARPAAGACARWAPCRRRPCRSARPPRRRVSSRRPPSSSTPGKLEAEEAVDVVVVQIGAPLRDERAGERGGLASQRASARSASSSSASSAAARRQDARQARAHPSREHVTERVRRIGGHDERSAPGAGGAQRHGGRARSSCRPRPCRRRTRSGASGARGDRLTGSASARGPRGGVIAQHARLDARDPEGPRRPRAPLLALADLADPAPGARARSRRTAARVISPSSRRICAARSSSRHTVSSAISASTAAAILPRTNLMPPTSSVSRMITRTPGRARASGGC